MLEDKAQKIIKEVIQEDFPFMEVEEILGYSVDEEKDLIVGQFVEQISQYVYNFSFGRDNPKPTLQRYL
jgi:hypothetical protein